MIGQPPPWIATRFVTLAVTLCLLAGTHPLRAETTDREAATQINSANQLLRDGDVDAALAAYPPDDPNHPPPAEWAYNRAVALYRKGDVAAAQELLSRVSADPNDALAAKARYNLGNCHYAAAVQAAEQDRAAAIQHLESAITHFRSALTIDPTDSDARANTELAARLIQQLESDQEQQDQEQQDQEQQDQEQQDQEQQDQEQQDQEQQDQEQQDQEQQDQGQQGQDQQDASQSGEESPPTGELTSTNENQDAANASEGHSGAPAERAKEGEMTEQEAHKMLQAIRDRDMLRRLRRQAAERRRHIPVDRDW